MAREKIRFLVDETGRKQSVVLPIKEYQDRLEDLALIAERKDEPAEPLDIVRGSAGALQRPGQLTY